MNVLTLSLIVFTQRNFVANFLQAKCDLTRKTAVLHYGSLGETYDNQSRLIGKRVVDFLLVLIELLFASCYGWGATCEYRFKIDDFAPTGAGWPKISGRRVAPTNHSSSLKTRLNDLSHGIKIRTDLSFVLSQCRQTERRTDTFLIVRAGISCSAEKRFIVLREKVYNAPSPIRVLKYGSDQVRLKYSVGLEFHIAVHIFF